MGNNTTVVVLNDALGEIAADPEFGRRLADAIGRVRPGHTVSVAAHHPKGAIHCNAALVVETHHADYDVLVRVGGNRGEVEKPYA
jgi:hypothetical protein